MRTLRDEGNHLKAVVHVGCFLEPSCTFETIRFITMRRSSHPADVVVRIELDAFLPLLFVDKLKTVVVYEDRRSSALASVRLHSFLDMVNRLGSELGLKR